MKIEPVQQEFTFMNGIREEKNFTRSWKNYVPLCGMKRMLQPDAPEVSDNYRFALFAYHLVVSLGGPVIAAGVIGTYLR